LPFYTTMNGICVCHEDKECNLKFTYREDGKLMKNIESIIEVKKENIFLKYPQQSGLTTEIFQLVFDMFQEELDLIEQKNKRLKIIYNCVISILEIGREHNVKKRYIIDLLDVFLDKDIVIYLMQGIEKYREEYVFTIKCAQAELNCSQWSDTSSTHWQRATSRLKIIK